MRFTQAQIDATARELHQHVYVAENASTDDRWQDYRDVARKALEAGHVAAPAPEVQEALELLDTLNEAGRMRYDDYVELHGIVSQLAPAEPTARPDTQDAGGFDWTPIPAPPEPSADEAKMRKSFAVIAGMADWWHRSADKVLERMRTETPDDVMLYHDTASLLGATRSVFGIAELHAQGAPEEPVWHAEGAPVAPPPEDVRAAMEKAWDEGVARAGRYGHEDHWTHDVTPYNENPYRRQS